MSLQLVELQARVAAVSKIYAERFDIERDRAWYALKLAEETGEACRAYLNIQGQTRETLSGQAARDMLAEELTDVIAHALLLASSEMVDLEAAFHRKWLSHLP